MGGRLARAVRSMPASQLALQPIPSAFSCAGSGPQGLSHGWSPGAPSALRVSFSACAAAQFHLHSHVLAAAYSPAQRSAARLRSPARLTPDALFIDRTAFHLVQPQL